MLTAPKLKEILAEYDIRPSRRRGQNFLVDGNIAEKMIRACELSREDEVLEIGAGLGALTQRLGQLAAKVTAVEKDRKLCAVLEKFLGGYGNVRIACTDFIEMDLKQFFKGGRGKIKAIGNLPYYITTPILEKLMENKDLFGSIFITVQKEVAQRLCAKPGSKDYGSVSCYVQFHMRPKILFYVNKRAFYPQPQVDSAFMELLILPQPPVEVEDAGIFFEIIRAAFGKRRKTILNSLLSCGSLGPDKAALAVLLKRAGIDSCARAEELCLRDFAKIADAAKKRR